MEMKYCSSGLVKERWVLEYIQQLCETLRRRVDKLSLRSEEGRQGLSNPIFHKEELRYSTPHKKGQLNNF